MTIVRVLNLALGLTIGSHRMNLVNSTCHCPTPTEAVALVAVALPY